MARRRRATARNKGRNTAPPKKLRTLLWVATITPLLLIPVAFIAYNCLISWLQGDSFRHRLREILRVNTGARQVSIPQNLHIEGGRILVPELDMLRGEETLRLTLKKVHIQPRKRALLRRILDFSQFSAEELCLAVRTGNTAPAGGTAPSAKAAVQQPRMPRHAATAAALPAGVQTITPKGGFFKKIIVHSFEAPYTDLVLRMSDGTTYAVRGSDLTAAPTPDTGRNAWSILLEDGQLDVPASLRLFSNCGVKSAKLLYCGDEVQLRSCKLLLSPGEMLLKGNYSLKDGQWQADLTLDKGDVSRLLNKDRQRRITGSLSGSMKLHGEGDGSYEADGKIWLTNCVADALPVLSDIRLDDSFPYRKLPIEQATCTLAYPYSDPIHNIRNAWVWDNINIRAENAKLLVRGRIITGEDGSLSGTLRMGIPSKTIIALGLEHADIIQRLFNAPVELPGYMWLHINLSGTVSDPQEDLSVRLSTILPQALRTLPEKATESLKNLLDTYLPQVPGAQPEDGQPNTPELPLPVQQAKDIINSGINAMF